MKSYWVKKIFFVMFSAIFVMESLMAEKDSMPSLEEMIGQMIIVGFHGTKASDPEVKIAMDQAKSGQISGVIFFGYNIENPEQIKRLTQEFSELSPPHKLLIAVDQEGGKVKRLNSKNGHKNFLSAKEVAKSMSPEEAQNYYLEMADMIKEAGFNCNFGPVVDLDAGCPVIGSIDRAYDNDANAVVNYASSFISAHDNRRVVTALKHYPGHGYASSDSHKGMVDITDTYRQLERVPFKQLIKNGKAKMVMTAHLVNRKVSGGVPATLSPTVVTEWLRNEDNFKGVVISDDLHMGAIGQHYSLDKIVINAINAGVDMLLFSNNVMAAGGVKDFGADASLAVKIHGIIIRAIAEGKIDPNRIFESYKRISAMKSENL